LFDNVDQDPDDTAALWIRLDHLITQRAQQNLQQRRTAATLAKTTPATPARTV
jgi:hypothetical protein